jgi:hypothetical protein
MFNRRLSIGSRFAILHGAASITVERAARKRFVVTTIGDFREGGVPFFRREIEWPAARLVLTRGGVTCQLMFDGPRPREVWVHAPREFAAGPAFRPRRSA